MSAQVIAALRQRSRELEYDANTLEAAQSSSDDARMLRWLGREFATLADIAEGGPRGLEITRVKPGEPG